MKIFGLIATLFITFSGIGQKSYYFSDPVPNMGQSITNVNKKYFGTYTASNGRIYELNEEGVFIISTSINSMSRESIRESAKFDVRNGFIHGVVEGDSIPCVLDGERYYFGVRNRDQIVGGLSNNILTRSDSKSNQYFINMKEEDAYYPIELTLNRNDLEIAYFDYEFETTVFDNVANTKSIDSGSIEFVILSPDQAEFDQLLTNRIFGKSVKFKKAK
jgi:hypothetical protein